MVVCLLEVASGVANGGHNFLFFLNVLTDRRGLLKDFKPRGEEISR